MANADMPRGLVPKRYRNGAPFCGALRKYYVNASDATALFIGDPVILSGTGDDRGVPGVTRATAGARATGVVCGIANDENVPASNDMMEVGYRAGGLEGYVLVCDDPETLFEVQEDSVGGSLAKTNIGQNIDFIVAAGSTFTRRSGVQIDSSTAAVTATLPFRIVELEQRPDNAIGAKAKWLVALNQSTEAPASAGI